MRAAIVPAINANWEIKDIPTPKPDINQVLIKIHASGLCYTDVHQTEGHLPGMFPRTLGHEPVGEIVETGPGVSSRRVGDRVGVPWVQSTCGRCEWCLRGRPLFCANMHVTGGDAAGGHAEYMVAPADATMLIPDSVSFEQAAPVFCAGYTVWSGLRWAEPKPHERVAVVGIGGLGHLAVQFAHAAGYETIAVSHSPDKDSLIKEMGADEIVRDGKDLLKMGGADIILSTTNSNKAMLESLGALRPDGRFVAMGFDVNPLQVSIADLIVKRIKIIGSQQNHREYLFEALDMVSKGKVKVVAETYSLNEINKAYEKVKNGQVRFRAVVTM
ncbi:alcohol dehydrogenase [Legionella quinlivanii]|uniref:alcohol dehydrogenase n=1 Tax=Legionella quinlivanii TaxID=45073 RepID=A0A364LIY7_9GAMM|nr:alcohol dehydrogenase catalytic domain-containing protein [Legionella quinlivanii]RAP36381.1 alcohol dehydrogenase [Legionella quinlivanii]